MLPAEIEAGEGRAERAGEGASPRAVRDRVQASLVGRWTLEDELGAGATSVVYRARDHRTEAWVALKALKPCLTAPDHLERFAAEVRITRRLSHPGILPVIEADVEAEVPYFTMPLVAGTCLGHRLSRSEPMGVGETLDIARDVADALAHAHANGIVHRDIKPGNVLLTPTRAHLLDFGIAYVPADPGSSPTPRRGLSVGTPAYMSPEQASGDVELDGRADVYSLACLVFHMLAGAPPFEGRTARTILTRKLWGDVPSLGEIRPSVPLSVEFALRRALSPGPTDRHPDMASFASALVA